MSIDGAGASKGFSLIDASISPTEPCLMKSQFLFAFSTDGITPDLGFAEMGTCGSV